MTAWICVITAWFLAAAVLLRAHHIAHRKQTPTKPEGEQK